MKLLGLVLACSFITFTARAEETAKPNLEAAKQEASANIDARTASLQKMEGCIKGAADKAAMKACREAHKGEMQTLHSQNKAKRSAKIDEKIKKLQDHKAKMEAAPAKQ